MSTINKFGTSTLSEDERMVMKDYNGPKDTWTLSDLKRGERVEEKTIGRPKSRKVSMTRRPLTATFDRPRMGAVIERPSRGSSPRLSGHRTRQPSSDVNVGAVASAHVSTGRHMHRTRQPSSDASVGSAASAHIGAARVREQFTPLELELMEQLMRARYENKRLHQIIASRNSNFTTMRRVRY